MMKDTDSTPGYEIPAVEAWIDANTDAIKPPFKWTKLQGGHSNLTYLIEDTHGQRAVIRRPPQGVLLPKAHDMGREWSIIQALGGSSVPVAQAIAFCEDPSVTGAHFYVMGWVNGHPLYTVDDANQWAPPALRETVAHSFVDVLADLHSIDPDQVGLGRLGKKEGYIARQVKTWYRSWNASIDGAQFDDPRAHELQQYFLAHLPEQGPARVVHGDYGVHNCLLGSDGHIAAVVDWEISTLGDPLADLAYALNQWAEPDDPPNPRGPRPTSVPGFPSRQQMADRYANRTGRDLSGLDYYSSVCFWKSAMIGHGVYARYCEGKKSTEGVDMPGLRASVLQSLSFAEQALST